MRRFAWAAVLVSAVSLSACGTRYQGGNNAPIYPAPKLTTTQPKAPTRTTSTTVKPQSLSANLPGGGRSYVGTPQYGAPWTVVGSADWVAARWMVAYKSFSYTDPGPGMWMVRIKPYTTPSFYASLLPTDPAARNPFTVAPADKAYWATVKQHSQSKSIQIVEVSRVNQAGFTPTSEIVEVLYDHYFHSVPGPQSSTPDNATVRYLCMRRIGGKWLVNNETLATNPVAC